MFDFEIQINETLNKKIFQQIALQIKPEWSKKLPIEIERIKGGLTNIIIACFLKSNGLIHNETILFRIYGEHTEKFISRSKEIEVMCLLSKIGLGPRFYGRFKNGICYEYLPGTILNKRMLYDQEIYPKIALAIAELHTIECKGLTTVDDTKPFIFEKIWTLHNLLNPTKIELKNEIEFIQNYLTEYTLRHKSKIVFSHNDLIPGNIIYNKDIEKEIKFIDYEYSSANYQAYDIANHFNEFTGIESPDLKLFPNKEFQLKWLTIYLKRLNPLTFSNEKLLEFYEEVNLFTLVSHLLWAIWSLVQAQESKLDFDYTNYAKIRLEYYNKRKIELIKKKQP